MAENSKIEWTRHTWNPWRGCTKVSEGCKNCYAETLSGRNPGTLGVWGPQGTRVVASEAMWREPLKWDKAAAKAGERHRVFCASLADVFEAEDTMPKDARVPVDRARVRLFKLIERTPHLSWLLLTKRPENILPTLKRIATYDDGCEFVTAWYFGGSVPSNVWVGTSVENQATADERIPHLLRVPAAVRFLSCEPLLGPIEFSNMSKRSDAVSQLGKKALSGIHWVIVGGESGHGARPMHPQWARSLRDQCQAAGVAFHYKQWGEWVGGEDFYSGTDDDAGPAGLYAQLQNGTVVREAVVSRDHWKDWDADNSSVNNAVSVHVGKKAAGRLLDGRTWDELPQPAGGGA